MKFQFIPIDYNPFDFEDKNYIKIYGRNEQGKRLCVIDECSNYLWAILKPNVSKKEISELIEKIQKIEISTQNRKSIIENVELKEKNFLGKPVRALKIEMTNNKDLQELANHLDFQEIDKRRGYDINYTTHYLLEKKLNPLNWYEIEGDILTESELGGISQIIDADFIINLKSFKKSERKEFKPKALAFDIETDDLKIGQGEILMISLAGRDFQKVITWKKSKSKNKYVEFVKNEEEMLEKFAEHIKNYSPDFLIGYNSDEFDMPYIKARADKLKMKLEIGLEESRIKLSRGINFSARINGITHIDLIKFIRTSYSQYMQSETLSLNEVAKEFLKDTKKDFKFKHSSKISGEEWDKFYEYNLHDSVLALGLFEKFWPDLVEFSIIIQEPLFEISRNGLSKQIESYILHNLEKYNEIPEKKPNNPEISSRMEQASVQGAFVYEPKPGLYENLAMFDFTSMHTSIIITHNISKATLQDNPKNAYASPEIDFNGKKTKFYFSKAPGFFPLILKDIFEKRKKYKEEYKKNPDKITKARSNAFKLLSASAHGYVGFFGARYYSLEASSSILAFVRKYNLDTIEKIKKAGYKVIMSDTDSVAFTLEGKTRNQVKELLKKLNEELPGVMELDLEDFFKRGIWVTTRSGETGAKKKYAMIDDEGNIKIRGFETVRRDWCKLARNLQDRIIRLILNEGNEKKALEYLKEIINKVKTRDIPREDLMIRTQLKKALADYKSISPHVVAAQKMKERNIPLEEGYLIEYYLAETKSKSKLVRDKVKLPDEEGLYNIEYYLTKQVIPAVENIFHLFNIEVSDLINSKKQENLGKWF
jgi:DNA polymerase I/DNA polymerase-2